MQLRPRSDLQKTTEMCIMKSIGINPFQNTSRAKRKTRDRNLKNIDRPNCTIIGEDGNRIIPNYILETSSKTNEKKKLVKPSLESLLELSLDELEEDDLSGCQQHLLDLPIEEFDGNILVEKIKKTIEETIHLHYPVFDYIKNESEVSKKQILSDVHCLFFLPLVELQNPIAKFVLKEDILEFFKYAYRHLSHHSEVKDNFSCLCDPGFSLLSLGKSVYATPLHLAAAYDRHNFLRAVMIDYCEWFESIDSHMSDNLISHFENIVLNWYNMTMFDSRAQDIAAENDHKESLKVFISYPYFNEDLLNSIENMKYDRFSYAKRSCESFHLIQIDTFLCKLAYHNNLDLLPENILKDVLKFVSDDHLMQMFRDSLCSGSCNSYELIVRHSENPLDLITPRKKRVGILENRNLRLSPPVHVAALYKNWDLFHREFKRSSSVRDCFGYTPLVYCLSFDNTCLNKAMRFLIPVSDKEEIFVFLHHLLIQKRYDVTTPMIHYIMRNSTILDERDNIDEKFGLPEYVPLPLLSVLISHGDVHYFQYIIEIYKEWQTVKTKPMIDEDIIQCIYFIQHHVFNFSDQMRLALIFMLLPVAPVESEKWIRKISSNKFRGLKDQVAEYILQMYKSEMVSQAFPLLTWKQSLIKAREAMIWNECTFEDDEENVKSVSFWRRGSTAEPGRSCLKTKL